MMKFDRKTKLDSEIPTASMPDIIFMLLIFFMVTTVLREYSGLPISLPKAKRIEKLKSKRHTSHIWVSKDGLISIEDKLYASDGIRHIMYEKRVADPQLVISLKADERAKMGLISEIHGELRKADALKLNYSSKTAVD
jgi:biopolymer transport protein ExbD